MRGKARKLYLAMGMALVAMLVAAGAVYATVTFDPATGKGFVGKGDVQLAFGWNDAQLQKNASGVSFTYDRTDTYEAVCTFITGEGTRGEQTHNVTHTTSTAVNSSVAYENRLNPKSKITGFNLTGFGATTETGTVPVVGGACPGNEGTEGTWSSVTLVSSTAGLFVHYQGGTGVQIA
jgi:hypothetical protein